MSKFFPTIFFNNPKVLWDLPNDYFLAPDKIEIKGEILFEYQRKTADYYNIPIGNAKKLMPNFFDKEKYGFIMKIYNFTKD